MHTCVSEVTCTRKKATQSLLLRLQKERCWAGGGDLGWKEHLEVGALGHLALSLTVFAHLVSHTLIPLLIPFPETPAVCRLPLG